jgi:hypothetical protein
MHRTRLLPSLGGTIASHVISTLAQKNQTGIPAKSQQKQIALGSEPKWMKPRTKNESLGDISVA